MKRPETQRLEVLSEASNYAVLQTPGRNYPGIVVQGDTLVGLLDLARQVAERLGELTDEEDEALWVAQELHDALLGRVLHYQDTLLEHGVELPYPEAVSSQARLHLVPMDEDEDDDENDHDDDPAMTSDQREHVLQLTHSEVAEIDAALLIATSSKSWRKAARVVGTAMADHPGRVQGIPDLFYAERLRSLIDGGQVLARGNPFQMGRCEVLLCDD